MARTNFYQQPRTRIFVESTVPCRHCARTRANIAATPTVTQNTPKPEPTTLESAYVAIMLTIFVAGITTLFTIITGRMEVVWPHVLFNLAERKVFLGSGQGGDQFDVVSAATDFGSVMFASAGIVVSVVEIVITSKYPGHLDTLLSFGGLSSS